MPRSFASLSRCSCACCSASAFRRSPFGALGGFQLPQLTLPAVQRFYFRFFPALFFLGTPRSFHFTEPPLFLRSLLGRLHGAVLWRRSAASASRNRSSSAARCCAWACRHLCAPFLGALRSLGLLATAFRFGLLGGFRLQAALLLGTLGFASRNRSLRRTVAALSLLRSVRALPPRRAAQPRPGLQAALRSSLARSAAFCSQPAPRLPLPGFRLHTICVRALLLLGAAQPRPRFPGGAAPWHARRLQPSSSPAARRVALALL